MGYSGRHSSPTRRPSWLKRLLALSGVAVFVLLLLRRNSLSDGYAKARTKLHNLVGFSASDDLQRQLLAGNATNYNHTRSAVLPRSDVSKKECDPISFQQVKEIVDNAGFMPESSPKYIHFHGGVETDTSKSFLVGTTFCSVFLVPQAPETNMSKFQNEPIEGWGPDAIHSMVWSEDIRLIHEHPDYWGMLSASDGKNATEVAVYTTAYALNHPGKYQIEAEVEFSHYDWVMEDPMDEQGDQMYPYNMLDRKFVAGSKDLIITGKPLSRPVERCFEDGGTDLRGRWYRAKAFQKGGSQSKQNPQARLEFAQHFATTDEWGWTFAPDRCTLAFFSAQDHLDCLDSKLIQCLGDSNSRRLFKSIIGGGVGWCPDKENRICNCEDVWEETIKDMLFNEINATHFQHGEDKEDPTPFGVNSQVFFDYVGGLVNQKIFNGWESFYDHFLNWPSVLERRKAKYGDVDLVHISLLGWDMAAVKTPAQILDNLPRFRDIIFNAYPNGTRFITRQANSLCCGNVNHKTRYSGPRFAIWNAMWKSYWAQDEAEGRMKIVDVTVLQGRADAEIENACPTTHFRGSHVRLEQMLWMNAVCEKPLGGKARMRNWG